MADTAPLLAVEGVTKRFGSLVANDDFHLAVATRSIHGLIGPNGAGKTTAIAQIFGELRPDRGRIRFAGRNVTGLSMPKRARLGLQRSYQITSLFPALTVEDNVALAVQAGSGSPWRFWSPARRDRRLRDPAREVLGKVGLSERAEIPAADLAHGEKRQLELAMVLATSPVLLLLDEPMAGLGREETGRMTEIIKALKGNVTVLLVEHDMDVVFALADRITVMVKGHAIATGAPAQIRSNDEVRRAYLGDY